MKNTWCVCVCARVCACVCVCVCARARARAFTCPGVAALRGGGRGCAHLQRTAPTARLSRASPLQPGSPSGSPLGQASMLRAVPWRGKASAILEHAPSGQPCALGREPARAQSQQMWTCTGLAQRHAAPGLGLRGAEARVGTGPRRVNGRGPGAGAV